MAIVRPFKGLRYNLEKVLLKQVIAPPYDVITPEYRENLVHRSEYNVVKIDLPQGENKYKDAAVTYNEWVDDGILIKEDEPAFYIYEQEYEFGGKSYIRTGFVGLLKLEEFGKGTVYPHEKTLSGPKQDRLELMKSCKANLSQIFGLYLDEKEELETLFSNYRRNMPIESAMDDDGVKHTIWAIANKDDINTMQAFMKDKAIYIADGHHRYETALMYRDMMREKNSDLDTEAKPYDFVMMMFVNFFDPGLMIFPTHRVVSVPDNFDYDSFMASMKKDFNVIPITEDKIDSFLGEYKQPGVMVMITNSGVYGLIVNQEVLEPMHAVYKNIDTYILQKVILNEHLHIPDEQILAKKGIFFYQTLDEIKAHMAKDNSIGFMLKGTSIDVIRQVSENGLVMPQKSTYFYPKLATGLLFNEI